MTLVGGFVRLEVSAVEVVRREEKPLVAVGVSFAILAVAMVLRKRYFPVPYQFGFELELPVFHGVIGGVDEVHDADAHAGAQGFNRSRNQMHRFRGVPNVRKIHHGGERFCIVNVGYTPPVLVSGWATVGLAVIVQVEEIHPQTDFRGAPAAHDGVSKPSAARGCMKRVRFG